VAQNVPGRHRAPGRFNAISELKTIAKESAQPAVKGAAIVAASGGLVASFAGTANAADGVSSAAAVVGPQVGTLKAANALSAIGYGKPALKSKPVVIEDIKVKRERAEAAAEKAAAEQAASERASAERASRFSSRVALNDAKVPSASGIVGIAQSFFGVPYVYGGSSPSGFDCSGLTSYVYRQAGISIPRTASAQQAAATRVSNPQPGDLVFFGSPAYHVGIYAGNGKMWDSPHSGEAVALRDIWTSAVTYGRP
jgi:cell wall-associated NlpC family hydrolase